MRYRILLVVIVAGCTNNFSLGGGGSFEPQQKETNNGLEDVVTVKNSYMVPSPPIYPREQGVAFNIVIENKDKKRTAKNVYVELYNPSVFTKVTQDKCLKGSTCTILPQGQKTVQFSLTAPSTQETGNVKVDTELQYRVVYDFVATTKLDVLVANMDEIISLQRAGKSFSPTVTKNKGSGPMKVDLSLIGEKQFVLDGYSATIKAQADNWGSGSLLNNEIEETSLKIVFPPEFDNIIAPGSPRTREDAIDPLRITGEVVGDFFSITGNVIDCTPPCSHGEGDCDSNNDCEGILVCKDAPGTDIHIGGVGESEKDLCCNLDEVVSTDGRCVPDTVSSDSGGTEDIDDSGSDEETEPLKHNEGDCTENPCKSGFVCRQYTIADVTKGKCCYPEENTINDDYRCAIDTCSNKTNQECRKKYGSLGWGSCNSMGLWEGIGKCPNDDDLCCASSDPSPPNIYKPGGDITDKGLEFRCTENEEGYTVCENGVSINLFKGKTEPFIFTADAPDFEEEIPYRTYSILAQLEYDYEVRDSFPVTIEEFN